MAENAAKSGAISGGAGGGAESGGGDPPRKSNMNGNRSGRFGGGSDPAGKKGANQKNSVEFADEEAKLLHKQQQAKGPQVVKGMDGTDVDSGGGGGDGCGLGAAECENGDLVKGQDGVSVIDVGDSAPQSYKPVKSKKKNVFKASYDNFLSAFEISKKSERPFMTMVILTLLLLLVIILLAIFWPRLPSYLTKEACLEAECLEASKQILSWSKPDVSPCRTPYEWACGRFEEKYRSHNFYGIHKGEWNFDAYQDYEDTTAAYEFISKLPTVALSYSAQSMVKKLHATCTSVETGTDSEGASWLIRITNALEGG